MQKKVYQNTDNEEKTTDFTILLQKWAKLAVQILNGRINWVNQWMDDGWMDEGLMVELMALATDSALAACQHCS